MITPQQLEEAITGSRYVWSAGDAVLYDLCRRTTVVRVVKLLEEKELDQLSAEELDSYPGLAKP